MVPAGGGESIYLWACRCGFMCAKLVCQRWPEVEVCVLVTHVRVRQV